MMCETPDREIRGIFPIAPATFTKTGEFDYGSYKNALRTLIEGGCHGVTLFGIAGEYYKLSYEEEIENIKITVDECKALGARCVISNTRHSTEVAVKWAKVIEDSGADCMMVLPPFFLKPGGESLYQHLKETSSAVSIPVIVQYAPEQTGVPVHPAIFAKLSEEVPNIAVYKIECKPPGHYISELLRLTEDGINVFIGNAGFQMIEGFDRGAVGVMPGCSMYDLYLQVYNSYFERNREKAIEVHNILVATLNHIRQNVEMIIRFEKMILKRRGIIESDYCRRPTHAVDECSLRVFDELYEKTSQYFVQ